MNIADIPAVHGARHRRKRVGRGIGSGHGKTATRGQKGQRARTGSRKRPGFEGGRNPLIRSLPKRGMKYKAKASGQTPTPWIVNVGQLSKLAGSGRITPEALHNAGLIRSTKQPVKLLGEGEVTQKFVVAVHAASDSAKEKITKAGGSIELLTTYAAPPTRLTTREQRRAAAPPARSADGGARGAAAGTPAT